MEGFKIDPSKYAGLPPGEAARRIAEDERKHINADPGLQAHILRTSALVRLAHPIGPGLRRVR